MLPFMKIISRDKRIKHLLLLPWGMGVLFHLSFKLFLYCTRSFIVVLVVVVVAALLLCRIITQRVLLKAFCPLFRIVFKCDVTQYNIFRLPRATFSFTFNISQLLLCLLICLEFQNTFLDSTKRQFVPNLTMGKYRNDVLYNEKYL